MNPDTPVRLTKAGGIATLTLNDPARMNPLTLPTLQAALAALAQVAADRRVRALVLRGEGRAFCVGADLSVFEEPSPGAPERRPAPALVDELLALGGNPLVLALRDLPVPVVCAVQGPVVGGGVGLALAADVVIAARSAYFYLPFVPALGLVPDLGSSWFMLRALGPARTAALTLLGDRLPAAQAAESGLVWACVDDDRLADQTARCAERLAALPVGSAPETRALLREALMRPLAAQLDYERERQVALMGAPAFGEGLLAFFDKRPPRFAGR